MGDFYSVLRQSIIERGLSSAAAREEAYAQARRAVINRLWAYDPPLAEEEIDHRIGQFDVAVARIEDDVVAVFEARTMADDDDRPPLPDDADGYRYPPAFGGTAADDDDVVHEPDDAPPAPARRVLRPSLDETSLAVERALREFDEEAPAAAYAVAAHDEELAAWPEPEEEPAAHVMDDDDDLEAEPLAASPSSDAPPESARKSVMAALAPAWRSLQARGTSLIAKATDALPTSDSSRLRLLVGLVVVLAVLFVSGLVWMLLPGAPPSAGPPVVLQTEVPGGVSDPDTAIRLPKAAITVTSSFSLFDGRDPTVFASDPDNPVRFDGQLARVATSAASSGAKIIIGAGLSSRLAGKTIRVTIDARSARENGAASMRFAYQSGFAISHWQAANLTDEFTEFGLVWRVPTMRTNPDGDYIVIEPGIPGSGTAVEIRSVRVDLVDQ
jgi:hypothetical protein